MTETEKKKSGFFSRLKAGLSKTRNTLAGGIDNLVHGKAEVGPQLLDDLEDLLISADVGVETSQHILDTLRKGVASEHIREPKEMVDHLKRVMVRILEEAGESTGAITEKPKVMLVIGVNGSGKTTTIGKLAKKWTQEGSNVILAAADTFRAAAIEQMLVWAERAGVTCIHQKAGADPSAVAFDAVQAGVARKADVVLIDTAGRLQTNTNLMEELKKIKRVTGKVLPGAPHETLLILDASIGQNSVSQARLFHEALKIDGLAMTKLDGTSKGGVLFNISRELKLPVRYIGVGEKAEDLQEFNAEEFVEALFAK